VNQGESKNQTSVGWCKSDIIGIALDAFEAHATDSLLKPMRQQRLREALDRLIALRRSEQNALDEFKDNQDVPVESTQIPHY